MKESCVVFILQSILLWYSPLMLYWVDLAHAYIMLWLQTSHLKPLWSFSFWLVISLYALINNVLSLCMIMAIIALLVGRFQSFASLRLYWVWALLVHPTPKNQSLPIVSTIPTYMWYFTATPKWISCVLPLNLQNYYYLFCASYSSWESSLKTIVVRIMLLIHF